MPYDNAIMGQVIRSLRKKHGLSQDILSGLSGIARSHLAMIETGYKSANVETLWRIAEALDMSLSELIAIVEKQHRCQE